MMPDEREIMSTVVFELHRLGCEKVPTQVSGPDQDVDAGLNNLGQGLKERSSFCSFNSKVSVIITKKSQSWGVLGLPTVSSRDHLGVRNSRALPVRRLGTDGRHDIRALKIIDIRLRWVGRLGAARLEHVVHVEVVVLLNGTLDGRGTGAAAVQAGRVVARETGAGLHRWDTSLSVGSLAENGISICSYRKDELLGSVLASRSKRVRVDQNTRWTNPWVETFTMREPRRRSITS